MLYRILTVMILSCASAVSVRAQAEVITLGTDTILYDQHWEYVSALETDRYMESYVFYANAIDAFDRKDYFAAKASVSKAIKLNKKEAKFKMLKAWILSREQSYKKAIKLCNKLLQENERHQEALYCKGLNQFLLKDYEGSIATYDRLITVNGLDAKAYFGRAEVLAKMDKQEAAIADYTAALMLDPKLALANQGRGMAYFKLFNYAAAAKDFNQYVIAYPGAGEGYYFRGLSYLRMNDYANACRSFKEAVQLNYRAASEYLKKYCEY